MKKKKKKKDQKKKMRRRCKIIRLPGVPGTSKTAHGAHASGASSHPVMSEQQSAAHRRLTQHHRQVSVARLQGLMESERARQRAEAAAAAAEARRVEAALRAQAEARDRMHVEMLDRGARPAFGAGGGEFIHLCRRHAMRSVEWVCVERVL